MCVCSCARSSCTRPLLVGVCGVGVCALGSGFGCAPPLPAGVFGCVCVRVRTPLVPRHSWLGCWGVCVCAWARVLAPPRHSWLGCWGVCVFVCPLRLLPATPGWGVRCGCVCFGSGFGCAPPLLARVLGCACVRVPVLLVPGHSWLGCAVWVCVLGLGVRLRPATPGWAVRVCVCLCAAPPVPRHSWLVCVVWVCVLGLGSRLHPATPGWVLGCVCVCVRAPLVPRQSWLGFQVWVCVLGLGFRLHPATPGWGVGMCVCLSARSACTPAVLAGVFGVGVCAWARIPAAHRHSWLGCWGVCVFVCALRLYPATPSWGVWCDCVCLGSGFGCAPPLLAGVFGCLCVCVRAPPVPRHSWLGCVVWVCVLGLGFQLRPATPGWGVGVCVCLCAHSACTPPLLAGVCWLGFGFRLRPATPGWGVGVCVCLCARSACTPPLLAGVCGVWVGCCLAPFPLPWFVACCAPCPGPRHPVAVVAWHLSVCRGCGRRRASLACLVAPPWCTVPRPVRSLPVLRSAFRTPWCLSPSRRLAPSDLLGGCAGHVEAGRQLGSLCLPLARAKAGSLGSLRVVPVRGPAMSCPWRVPPPSVLGCVPCGGWPVLTWSLKRPVCHTAHPSTGDLAGAPGLSRVDADTAPLGSEDATPGSPACVRVRALLGRVGRAGIPGAFWCPSPFPVAALCFFFVRPPPGLGRPVCCGVFFSFLFVRPRCVLRSVFSGLGCLGT